MRVVANALVALYQVEGDADWSGISDLIGAGSPAGDPQGRRARERRMRPAIRRRDDLRRERGSRRGVFLGRRRAWRPRPARPRPTGVGVAHEAPDLGCAWVASYAAICSDLQARGAEVMAKKDPLPDLLIRGSRVRIPDGSPFQPLPAHRSCRSSVEVDAGVDRQHLSGDGIRSAKRHDLI